MNPSDARDWKSERIADLEARLSQADEVVRALNGFRWLGNNLHNIEADPGRFEELYRAASEDAEAALSKYQEKA